MLDCYANYETGGTVAYSEFFFQVLCFYFISKHFVLFNVLEGIGMCIPDLQSEGIMGLVGRNRNGICLVGWNWNGICEQKKGNRVTDG